MAKFYSLQFGSGDPRPLTGLAPTFLIFVRLTDGATIAPPAITESLTSSGMYQFTFGTTQPISFLADAATTSPGTAGRYVFGQIDPADRIDEIGTTIIALGVSGIAQGNTAIAIGTSNIALGTTILAGLGASALGFIGTTASIIGDNVTSPVDLFGYLKRIRELIEGQETFIKGSGVLTMFERTGATTLAVRTVSNNASLVIKA